eukprot:COSAG03_NODE_24632_length_271_cov_0.593023_1_plen_46_part_10
MSVTTLSTLIANATPIERPVASPNNPHSCTGGDSVTQTPKMGSECG